METDHASQVRAYVETAAPPIELASITQHPAAGGRSRRAPIRPLRPLRTAAVAGLAAAVVGGGVIGTQRLTQPQPPAPSARALLTAALSETLTQSYRYSTVTRLTASPTGNSADLPRYTQLGAATITDTGVVDPVSGAGTDNYQWAAQGLEPPFPDESDSQTVHLGGASNDTYNRTGSGSRFGPWEKLTAGEPTGSVTGIPLDVLPLQFTRKMSLQQLFSQLKALEDVSLTDVLSVFRSAGQVHAAGRASGPGWSGTRYAFTYTTPADATFTMPGVRITEYIGVDQEGRVRSIDASGPGDEVLGSRCQPGVSCRTAVSVSFSDFGVPVHVTAPAGAG